MVFLLFLKWNLLEQVFFCAKTKINSNLAVNVAEGATAHFFYLFDESPF